MAPSQTEGLKRFEITKIERKNLKITIDQMGVLY